MEGLIGGYGSDDSDSDQEEGPAPGPPAQPSRPSPPAAPAATPSPSPPPAAEEAAPGEAEERQGGGAGPPKRKKVDYSKLPVSRPLEVALASQPDDGEAPLRRAAELARQAVGRSLLASLPPPKVTLGLDPTQGGSSGVRIDLAGLAPRREKPTVVVADVLRREGAPDLIVEEEEVPESIANHPMFSHGLQADGPSQEDLQILRKEPKFIKISSEDMKDPDWFMKNQISGGPGLHKGKKVPVEASNFEANKWKQTTHADPSRIQKRKHQINWLAHDAMENEAELLDRNASGKLSKAQTSLKYGW